MVIHAPPELCYMLSLSRCHQFSLIHLFLRAEMVSHTIILLPLSLTVGRSLHLLPLERYPVCGQTARTQTHQCTTHYTNFSLTIVSALCVQIACACVQLAELHTCFCRCSARMSFNLSMSAASHLASFVKECDSATLTLTLKWAKLDFVKKERKSLFNDTVLL